MNDNNKIAEIVMAMNAGSCLCSSRESCEICRSNSQYNILRGKIIEIINGPKPMPTLEDYGRTIKLETPEIGTCFGFRKYG